MSVTLGTAPGALGWPLVTLGSGSVEGEPVSAVSVEFGSKGEQRGAGLDQELVWWPASELRRVWKTGRPVLRGEGVDLSVPAGRARVSRGDEQGRPAAVRWPVGVGGMWLLLF